MPKQTTHPSEEKLSAYNRGLLPPDETVAIETHVSECEPCCETIVGLSSDDTFVGLLKEARQLPVDRTPDHDSVDVKPSSFKGEIPAELAEHPRYEIVRLIGKGGMGDVYEAIHRKMERRVALKVINRDLFQKAEAVNRFHREVKTAAQLSHPNIVTAHDADQAGDFHFMVMEYVDGVDLSQTVKDRGALPVDEACDYIRQAAIGLQHAHECGMVHRDIKPHNLMVTSDGTVKILDFGLASLTPEAMSDAGALEARGDLTAAGAIMGTPDFISPEQAEDAHQADIRSDIYSLGSTLYFLLSAQPPFAEGSVMHKLKSHAESDPEPLDTVRLDVPADLAAVITKMMAKDPDERFQTPEEVAAALCHFVGDPSPAASPHQGRSVFKWLGGAALIAAVAAMVAFSMMSFLPFGRGVESEPRHLEREEELELLQGDWEIVTVIEDGQMKSRGELVRVQGNILSFIEHNGTESLPFEIDSTTDPKRIDLIDYKKNADDRFLGIYEIKEDTLKICFIEQVGTKAGEGNPVKRPTKFAAPAGSDVVLVECRRVVNDPDPKQLRGDAANAAQDDAGEQLSLRGPAGIPPLTGKVVASATDGEDSKSGWKIAVTLPKDTWREIQTVMPKLDWPDPTWNQVRPGFREGTMTLAGDSMPTWFRVIDMNGKELGRDQIIEQLKTEQPVLVSPSGQVPHACSLQLPTPAKLVVLLGPGDKQAGNDLSSQAINPTKEPEIDLKDWTEKKSQQYFFQLMQKSQTFTIKSKDEASKYLQGIWRLDKRAHVGGGHYVRGDRGDDVAVIFTDEWLVVRLANAKDTKDAAVARYERIDLDEKGHLHVKGENPISYNHFQPLDEDHMAVLAYDFIAVVQRVACVTPESPKTRAEKGAVEQVEKEAIEAAKAHLRALLTNDKKFLRFC